MVSYNNAGQKVAEINVLVRREGGPVITSTTYINDRVVVQHITTRDNQGKVDTRDVFGGRLIP